MFVDRSLDEIKEDIEWFTDNPGDISLNIEVYSTSSFIEILRFVTDLWFAPRRVVRRVIKHEAQHALKALELGWEYTYGLDFKYNKKSKAYIEPYIFVSKLGYNGREDLGAELDPVLIRENTAILLAPEPPSPHDITLADANISLLYSLYADYQ